MLNSPFPWTRPTQGDRHCPPQWEDLLEAPQRKAPGDSGSPVSAWYHERLQAAEVVKTGLAQCWVSVREPFGDKTNRPQTPVGQGEGGSKQEYHGRSLRALHVAVRWRERSRMSPKPLSLVEDSVQLIKVQDRLPASVLFRSRRAQRATLTQCSRSF